MDLAIIDVQLDYTLAHNGARNWGVYNDHAGLYPGFDRYGRVIRQTWADGDLKTHASDATLPDRPPLVEQLVEYDKASNRLRDVDGRPGAQWAGRDRSYDYDGLHRVRTVERGVWDGTAIAPAKGGKDWSLDVLGNWESLRTDLNGNGTFGDLLGDQAETRTHNDVNEVLTRTVSGGASSNPNPAASWDPAGNMVHNNGYTYVHDAWNRLVEVRLDPDRTFGNGDDIVIGRYEYYGTHRRSVREFDGDAPYDGLDERRELYWSGDWRLLEERIDEGFSAGVRDIDVVAQQFWGERHLDDAVLRRRRDEPGTWANDTVSTAYALTDVQFNAVAQVDGGAQLLERVVYEPYGRALHHRPHDVDGDGDADANDQQIISDLAFPATGIADAAYRVEADLNRDGIIDANDSGHFNALGFAAGLGFQVSDPAAADNAFGFGGYHFDRETRQYHVRHRVYDPALGRFIQRDPLGYADGMSLYEYVGSSPFIGLDPMGLEITRAAGGGFYADLPRSHFSSPVQHASYQRAREATLASYRSPGMDSLGVDAAFARDRYHRQFNGFDPQTGLAEYASAQQRWEAGAGERMREEKQRRARFQEWVYNRFGTPGLFACETISEAYDQLVRQPIEGIASGDPGAMALGALGLIPQARSIRQLDELLEGAEDLLRSMRRYGDDLGQQQGRAFRVDSLQVHEFDPNAPRHVRGWLRNERRRGGDPRTPPGYQQAHGRTTPAREGFDYSNSRLQGEDLNKLEESVRRRNGGG